MVKNRYAKSMGSRCNILSSEIIGESVPNVDTRCFLRVGSRCDTRVAVGKMSWLGLDFGREHWPTPAFTEVNILCSDRTISSTNTMHSTDRSL